MDNTTLSERSTPGSTWIADLGRKISEQHIVAFTQLFTRVAQVSLTPEVPDDITWRWTSTGIYTV